MKMRMLTAIAASAMCLAAVSGAEAGQRKGGGGHGDWDRHHSGGHHGGGHHGGGHHGGGHNGGGHHGGGHNGGGHNGGGHHGGGHHGNASDRDTKAETSRGCDDHWDHNLRFQPNAAFNRRCSQAGLGFTITGTPGMWTYGAPGFYSDYPYQYDAYGRAYGY